MSGPGAITTMGLFRAGSQTSWLNVLGVSAGCLGVLGCTSPAPDGYGGMAVGASGATTTGTSETGGPGPTGGNDASAGATTGSGGSANSGGTSTTTGGAVVQLPDEPTPALVRRLTHIEYDNTVEDLLGDTTAPARTFTVDIAQDGFTNAAAALTVSPSLVEQYMVAAEDLSRAATVDLVRLLGCDPDISGEQACVEPFIRDFGKRAWRRPLDDAEQTRMLGVFSAARAEFDLSTSVQLVLQVFLQAPQFIYLLEPAAPGAEPQSVEPLDDWQLAVRLSYFLLGSLPDATLFAAAEAGTLSTPEQLASEARRLLTLDRARERIGLFFREWLYLRNVDRMQKDPAYFPDYDLSLGPLLREQLELFAQSVILDEGGSGVDLLTASHTFVSPELAPIYGVAAPTTPGFTRVELDPRQRSGLLTHAGLLASLAKADQTDPVHRGKFVRERLLCETVPPPPPDANITPPVITPGSTTRERFAQHESVAVCAQCHKLMDPIGLGFEHFDALGQWRDLDAGFAVDASGEILGSDVAGPFDGATELAVKLAQSRQVMNCIAQTWFRFALGRSVSDGDRAGIAALGERFADSGFNMAELLIQVTQSRAFGFQLVPDPNLTAFPQEEEL